MLHGPQTPGELRSRSERLYPFDDLSAVQATLDRLAAREPASESSTGPLTAVLPRQPGAREARYAHLLSGEVVASAASPLPASQGAASNSSAQRIVELEAQVAELSSTIEAIVARVERLEAAAQETFPSPVV